MTQDPDYAYSSLPYFLWVMWHPTKWNLWCRRAFALTIPVSAPVWLVSMSTFTVLFYVLIVAIAIFNTVFGELWDRRDGE